MAKGEETYVGVLLLPLDEPLVRYGRADAVEPADRQMSDDAGSRGTVHTYLCWLCALGVVKGVPLTYHTAFA